MEKQKILSYLSIILWILLFTCGVSLYLFSDMSTETLIFGAKNYILQNLVYGILIFIISYILRPLFFIPASPFDVFSGMVFGPIYGTLISSIATFFSTMFSYGVGNITSGQLIEKIEGKKILKLKKRLGKDTFFTAMMMRLVILPYDLGNYVCGALKIPFWKYVAGTTLGIIPSTFVFVSAGSALYGGNITNYETMLANVSYSHLIFSSVFFIIVLITARILKEKHKFS